MPHNVPHILQLHFAGNTLGAWILALIIFLVVPLALPIARHLVGGLRRRWSADSRHVPHAVEIAALLVARTRRVLLWIAALYLATRNLALPRQAEHILTIAVIVVFWLQVALWAMAVVRSLLQRRSQREGRLDPQLAGSLELIMFVTGIVVWALTALLALTNLGVNVVPLLAGLGIGGIAVALAVQSVLSDLLASIAIALDKPFLIGDFLIFDDFLGSVEHIGVKTTRLRSLSGEQIVVSNANLLGSRLRNYGRMAERRVVFHFAVTYETPLEVLRALPGLVQKTVESLPKTRFDRCHFLNFTEYALQFETVYYVLDPSYNVYADLQQTLNLTVLERIEKMGAKLALPGRMLHIEPDKAAVASAAAGVSRSPA